MAWMHKSAKDLEAAGYQFRFIANCRSKKCGRMLFFYTTPRGGTIPVDPKTFTPHFETCPEPTRFRKKAKNSDADEVAASRPDTSRPTDPPRAFLARSLPKLPQRSLFDEAEG